DPFCALLRGKSFVMRNAIAVFLILLCSSVMFGQQLHGEDVNDLDRSVDPCNDFFHFANGTWRKNNPIPASMTRWSKRWQAGETSKDKLRDILEDVTKNTNAPKGSTEQLIGDYYGACMDTAKVNARGVEPIKPWFAEIEAAKNMATLQITVEKMHDIGVTNPFNLSGAQDLHNPKMVIADIGQSALGLPERDYYLKPDKRFAEAREKYKEHITTMFKLVGWDEKKSAAAAQTVMAMETKFAEAKLGNAELRNPQLLDHKTSFAELQAMVPHFNWAEYYNHKQLPQETGLNVDQPKFMKELDRQLAETPIADWKVYYQWHLLSGAAANLSDPLVNEDFAFNEKYLSGTNEIKPRWKRCTEQTDQFLGEALGQLYVKKYFPPEAKARMQDMVKNLLAAMKEDINSRPWMSPETKQKAMEKLATFNPKIGYPDKWKDYSKVDIRRDTYFEDVIAGAKYVIEDDRQTIGKPVDRGRWGMTPPTSDAYYNPLLNEFVFPAGILQPPAFYVDAVDAVNYGAIGVVIGHEISHGFDDEGAQFDAQGKLQNWWTDA